MTEEQSQQLSQLESSVRKLIAICREQELQIDQLSKNIEQMDEELQKAQQESDQMKQKYTDLLTVNVVAPTEEQRKDTRSRLNRLIRQVDQCIRMVNQQG